MMKEVICMKKQTNRLKRNENLVGWAFVAPTMIAFLVMTAGPFFFSMFLSLADWKFFNGWEKLKFVGFENFIDIFDDAIINLLNDTFSLLPQRSDSSRVCIARNVDFDINIAHVVLKRG